MTDPLDQVQDILEAEGQRVQADRVLLDAHLLLNACMRKNPLPMGWFLHTLLGDGFAHLGMVVSVTVRIALRQMGRFIGGDESNVRAHLIVVGDDSDDDQRAQLAHRLVTDLMHESHSVSDQARRELTAYLEEKMSEDVDDVTTDGHWVVVHILQITAAMVESIFESLERSTEEDDDD